MLVCSEYLSTGSTCIYHDKHKVTYEEIICIILGLTMRQREVMLSRKRTWQEAMSLSLPPLPQKMEFEPKFKLPKLDNYYGVLKASYWTNWSKTNVTKLKNDKSWVCPVKMKDLATRARLKDKSMINRVCSRLAHGAELGVEGRGRLPTRGKNSATVYENGFAMADALQEAIMDGYMAGPYMVDELVAILGPDYTINPMNIKFKPNGRIRLIIDASSPHDRDDSVPSWIWNPKLPGSINSTIDLSKFPTRMSSLARFVKTLWRVGRGALVCKIDWRMAYKCQHVRKEDLKLQVVEFGGRFFVEVRLMFGTRSSPGIYDDLAKCFLFSVIELTEGITRNDVEQHLDDVLGVGPPGEDSPIHSFFNNYLKEAENVGIKLDQSGNREKVQPPDTTVTALGVQFDTVSWTWKYKKEKLIKILHTLDDIRQGKEMEFRQIQSIVGKLIDVRFLVKGGRYNMLLFLIAANQELKPKEIVKPTTQLKEQAQWWMIALVESDKFSPILHPNPPVPSHAMEGWTDAAGGSTSHVGAGLGGLVPPYRYFYMPWPEWLNRGMGNEDGEVFARKLTCLELLGPLVLLATCGDQAAGAHLRCYIDNQGAVEVYRKGHSTKCVYTSTIAKAIHEVAESIGATVTVEKVLRCSDKGSYTADMISKGNMREVRAMLPLREAPCTVPQSILSWVKEPRLDMNWSRLILADMAKNGLEIIKRY